MKTIFKEGDRVYHFLYGWGDVIEILDDDDKFWVRIQFDKKAKGFEDNFREGFLVSFTEYTLEGFSQERPEELPERGQIVWGKNFDEDNWHIGHFYLFDKSSMSLKYCISSNPAGNKNLWVQEITTENPYENN